MKMVDKLKIEVFDLNEKALAKQSALKEHIDRENAEIAEIQKQLNEKLIAIKQLNEQ